MATKKKTVVTSLKDQAALQIAMIFWKNCDFLDHEKGYYEYIGGIQADKVAEHVDKLDIPVVLKKFLEQKIYFIVEEMNEWWDKHERWIRRKPHIFHECSQYFHWKPDGTIDYKKTKQNLDNASDSEEEYEFDESDGTGSSYDWPVLDDDDDDEWDDDEYYHYSDEENEGGEGDENHPA